MSALNSYGAITVFMVWNSIPGLDGSSKLRIAECAPTSGSMSTWSGVATFCGRVTEPAVLKVPSFPTQLRLYVFGPEPPVVRVSVYVREYESPAVTPSRS